MAVIKYEEVDNNDYLKKHSPLFLVTSILSRKWNVILLTLLRDTKRFNELRKAVPEISPSHLSRTLKELEELNLIQRTGYGGHPPKVEYTLTKNGENLTEIFDILERWGTEYASQSKMFKLPEK